MINKLSETGLQTIEATAFVSAKWVPQMGDNTEVYSKIVKKPNVSYPVLTPNIRGLESAMSVGVKEVAVFGAASESFSMKNINCTIEESLDRFSKVIEKARENAMKTIDDLHYTSYENRENMQALIDNRTLSLELAEAKRIYDIDE